MGDAATTSVETDTTNTDTGNTDINNSDSLLTGDNNTNESGVNKDSKTDANANVDDTANTDVNQNDSDTGAEGSDVPPDTYADFALPEGMQLDEAALAEANPMFKELGLTQEQGQKVIDLYAKQIQASSEKQIDNFNQLMNDWRETSVNDKEFGGDKFEENVKIAKSAISKYGTPELKQLLDEHGVGNHPEVVRFMVRVGNTLKEDVPGSNGATPTKAEDHVSILYPNSSNKD